MGELPDARHSGDDELLHPKFGRGVQVARGRPAVARIMQRGSESSQMRLQPGAHLQGRRVDLDVAARGKEVADRAQDMPALLEPAAPRREAIGPPPFLHRRALVLAGTPTYVS